MKYSTLLPILACLVGLTFIAPAAPAAVAQNDIEQVANGATDAAGLDNSWDQQRATLGLVDSLRGLATVILLIALVVSAMSAGITGKTTMAIFVAVGAVVLYGGFWVALLIVENLGGPVPASNEVTFDGPAAYDSVIAKVIKDFIGYGINMLTTATMPFLMIYGFWLSLGVASGESGSGSGAQIKNYTIGAIVAIGASIFTQIFFRW